jgi:hypothetical protein
MAGPFDYLNPDGRSRIEHLLARQWASSEGHALDALKDKQIGPLRLIVLLGPKNNVGSRYFQLFLSDAQGALSEDPLGLGLFNTGLYPAFNWAELSQYEPVVTFAGKARDIRTDGDDLALFEMLSALVPAGGHLMVEYDSPFHEATARMLTLGYPPATTPLGYRLFQAGVRSFRDWYISEGGREGPRKLQGFKPLNDEIAAEKTAALLAEVEAVLSGVPMHGEWGEAARRNAAAVVEALSNT